MPRTRFHLLAGALALALGAPARAEPVAEQRFLKLDAAFSLAWRSYQLCPDATHCSHPAPGTGMNFHTDTPYSGFSLTGALFPFSGRDSVWAGLGLVGGYGLGFMNVRYNDEAGQHELLSSDSQFQVDLVYRYPLRLSGMPGFAGVLAGYEGRVFGVPENQIVQESRRSYPFGGLEASLPLLSPVRLDLLAGYTPFALAGPVEQKLYGKATEGRHLRLRAGLASELWSSSSLALSASLAFDYSSFQDLFAQDASAGAFATGGAASESYATLYAIAAMRF